MTTVEDLERNDPQAPAQDEVVTIVDVTLGEYMSNELPVRKSGTSPASVRLGEDQVQCRRSTRKNKLSQMNAG